MHNYGSIVKPTEFIIFFYCLHLVSPYYFIFFGKSCSYLHLISLQNWLMPITLLPLVISIWSSLCSCILVSPQSFYLNIIEYNACALCEGTKRSVVLLYKHYYNQELSSVVWAFAFLSHISANSLALPTISLIDERSS